MFIQTEETPNPDTLKFLPGQEVSPSGAVEFISPKEAGSSPLAQRLFAIKGVEGVFLGGDFVSVSKKKKASWEDLKPLILGALMEHLSTGQPVLLKVEVPESALGEQEDDEIALQIKELLAVRVRPMVAMDGGDIVFERFEEGIVYLRMKGACSGCPSATATLKMGVENMLRHFIPEVQEVRPVQD